MTKSDLLLSFCINIFNPPISLAVGTGQKSTHVHSPSSTFLAVGTGATSETPL